MLSQNFTPAVSARNLGVTFANNLNFRQHILQTCCCCFYHVQDLRRTCRSLAVAKKLWQLHLLAVHLTIAIPFIIIYNVNYINNNLKYILKLQLVQNYLARVVTRSPCFSHSVPLLKSLHWLPVQYRIIFKICTITYEVLSSKQPAYLNSLLTPARQPRQLQSSNSDLLFVPSVKTNVRTRAFFSCCTDHSSLVYQYNCLQLHRP